MTSKERVLATLSHQEPDKIPIDSWLAPEISAKLVDLLNIDLAKDEVLAQMSLCKDFVFS